MNIVIADDEQIILKWLKKNIEELSSEYHVMEACLNGKQVLNCCLNQQVDVLFTDIRMPVMDGLELLEKLNANHVMPYTVILSAYDDFAYVRDAFKLGASEFLLKPEITKENLGQCMEAAARSLKKGQVPDEKETDGKELLPELLEQYFINSESLAESALSQHKDEFSGVFEKNFMISILHSYGMALYPKQIREITGMLFQEEELHFQCIPQNDREMILISEVPCAGISLFLTKLYAYLSSFGMDEIAVSVSGTGTAFAELDDVYRQAKEVDDTQFFYRRTGGLEYSCLRSHQKKTEPELQGACQSIRELLGNHSCKEIQDKAGQMMLLAEKNMVSVTNLKRLLMELLLSIYWNYMDAEQRNQFDIPCFLALNDAADIKELKELFLNQMMQMVSLMEEKYQLCAYSDSVRKVMKYIEVNYSEDIHLDDLSNYVHLNRSYLSTRFKREAGINIYGYLLNYRLEKAKELLSNTNDLIQQICYQVGIPDSAYFSKQFKKYTGESPLEYRRMHK